MKKTLTALLLILALTLTSCGQYAITIPGVGGVGGSTEDGDNGNQNKPDDGGEETPPEEPVILPTEGIIYTLSEDGSTATVTGYEGEALDIIIAPDYEGVPVTEIGEAAFREKPITSVVIPDGVITVGRLAFKDCAALRDVTFGGGLKTVGELSFDACTALSDVVLPDSVTTVSGGAFRDCRGLRSVDLGDSVESIGTMAFAECCSLTSITLPASLTTIDYGAFICYKLVEVINHTTIEITAGGESGGHVAMFAKKVHNGETEIVNENGYLFYNIDGRNYLVGYTGNDTAITLPESFGGESYEIYDWAFAYRKNLESVTIPAGVTEIGENAFNGCGSITEITVPFVGSGIREGNVPNRHPFGYLFGSYSYENCVAIEQVYYGVPDENGALPATDVTYYVPASLRSVTVTGGKLLPHAFRNCTTLTSVTLPDGITEIGGRAFLGCKNLITMTLPETVTSIGAYAFSSCNDLVKINIPAGVTTIGAGAFGACNNLVSIELPAALTSLEAGTFSNCYALVEVINHSALTLTPQSADNGSVAAYAKVIHSEESKIVNENGYLFISIDGTNQLVGYIGNDTVLTLPESFGGEGYRIYKYAFAGREEITDIDLGGATLIGESAFSGCESLVELVVPDSVTAIGYGAFKECTALVSVTIGNGTLSIDGAAFDKCTALETLTVGGALTAIGTHAFRECAALKAVSLPDTLLSIGAGAFIHCSSLESVALGSGLKSIGSDAFTGCAALTSATLGSTAGWTAKIKNSTKTFTEEELSDPAILAEYIRITYSGHTWSRSI